MPFPRRERPVGFAISSIGIACRILLSRESVCDRIETAVPSDAQTVSPMVGSRPVRVCLVTCTHRPLFFGTFSRLRLSRSLGRQSRRSAIWPPAVTAWSTARGTRLAGVLCQSVVPPWRLLLAAALPLPEMHPPDERGQSRAGDRCSRPSYGLTIISAPFAAKLRRKSERNLSRFSIRCRVDPISTTATASWDVPAGDRFKGSLV